MGEGQGRNIVENWKLCSQHGQVPFLSMVMINVFVLQPIQPQGRVSWLVEEEME